MERYSPLAVRFYQILDFTRIDRQYRLRAVKMLLLYVALEPFNLLQHFYVQRLLRKFTLKKDPVFIISFYRSGTTYLQNLMSKDPELGYMSLYEAVLPNTILLGGRTIKRIVNTILSFLNLRFELHNVKLNLNFPNEEDVGMVAGVYPAGANWGFMFPRKSSHFWKRFLTLESDDPDDRAEWKRQYDEFVKLLYLNSDEEQLVLKTLPNMARISALLELYPDAKFIFLHRNPYNVFPSNRRLWKTLEDVHFHQLESREIDQRIVDLYVQMHRKYDAEKSLIPEGNLVEIAYEDLSAAPLKTLEGIYRSLELSGFNEKEPIFQAFIDQYKKTGVTGKWSLEDSDRLFVEEHWGEFIERWNYSIPN